MNNREIALVFWIAAFACWCLTQRQLRASLAGCLKALFCRQIVTILAAMAMFIWLQVSLLEHLELWDLQQLKNTIVWGVFVASASVFRITTIKDFRHYARDTFRDNLKLIFVLEFIIAFYTFSLIAELLLVPASVLIGALMASPSLDKKYSAVATFFERVAAIFGLFLICYASYRLVTDFDSFARQETLPDVYLPPLLSLSFLPFTYILMVSMRYEKAFLKLRFKIKKPSLRRFAKLQAIMQFHINLRLLERWVHSLVFLHPQTKADVRSSIEEIRRAEIRQVEALHIPDSWGWSPYSAARFLEPHGLIPGDYHLVDDDEWTATSPYVDIEGGILPSNVAYYIDGDELVAKRLKLVLNVYASEPAEEAHLQFLEITRMLYREALAREMPPDLEQAILSGTDRHNTVRSKAVSLRRIAWPSPGYEIQFEISVEST